MPTAVRVRAFTAADAEAVARISALNGQPDSDSGADPAYLAHVGEAGTVLVAVAEHDEVVAWGASTATGWGDLLTDLFVHPDWHGRGLGTAVLGHLWPPETGEQPRFTFSSWHAHALPLYARAGLVPSWPLLYLSGDPTRLQGTPANVVRQKAASAATTELLITGFDRTATYAYWGRRRQAAGFAVYEGSDLVAAGIGSPAELIHLACAPEADASSAVVAALRARDGTHVTICLPGPHPALLPLLSAGFRVVDHDVHMASPGVTLPTTWVYSPGLA